jgi:hypothetical protein
MAGGHDWRKDRTVVADCLRCKVENVSRSPSPKYISTSYVERQNLTMRLCITRASSRRITAPNARREPPCSGGRSCSVIAAGTGNSPSPALLTVTRTCQMQQLNVLAYLTTAIRAHRRRQNVGRYCHNAAEGPELLQMEYFSNLLGTVGVRRMSIARDAGM